MGQWRDARQDLPDDGQPVAAAITGRYRAGDRQGEQFWMVRPMVFAGRRPSPESDEVVEDTFVDSDGIVRRPVGGDSDEVVTHWAALPDLPGAAQRMFFGTEAETSLALALA